MIFSYKHKDVVNSYLYLLDQFNLKNYVIIDSFFVTISTFEPAPNSVEIESDSSK